MKFKSYLKILIVVGDLFFAIKAWGAPLYNVVYLHPLDSILYAGATINNNKQIVVQNNAQELSIYENGTLTKINIPGIGATFAGINSSGQIVAYSQDSTHQIKRSYLYSNGTIIDIGSLAGGDALANDINDSGQIVGTSTGSNGLYYAFLYDNGKMINLAPLEYVQSNALAINSSGQIAGAIGFSRDFFGVGFFYDKGVMTYITPSVFNAVMILTDINDSGQIVGYSSTDPDTDELYGFLYQNGQMTNLGSLGGRRTFPNSINNSGQIVGYSDTYENVTGSPFLYTDGQIFDINELITGWRVGGIGSINDFGEMAAVGCNSTNLQCGLLLLEPVDSVRPIPEPRNIFLLGIMLLGLCLNRPGFRGGSPS